MPHSTLVRYRPGFITRRTASTCAQGTPQLDRGALAIEFLALTVVAALIVTAVVAMPALKTVGTWTASSVNKILDDKDDVPVTGGGGGVYTVAGAPNEKAAAAVKIALQQVGKPYVWGAHGPGSFDCSGLMEYSYRQVGVHIQMTSETQYNSEPKVKDKSDLKPGDLVFFDTPGDSQSPPNHVGMYIGNGNYVEAPQPGETVHVTSMNSGYAQRNYWGATRPTGGSVSV